MKNVWFLHGFLGEPRDGEFLRSMPLCEVRLVDYFKTESISPKIPFFDWGNNFCAYLKDEESSRVYEKAEENSSDYEKAGKNSPGSKVKNEENVLIGYSLGGRLAAHAFLAQPELFSQLILVSSHLGLTKEADKKMRREADHKWADDFLNMPWDQLMKNWFNQSVFQGQKLVERREKPDLRRQLSESLVRWSLSEQADLSASLMQHSNKISFIYGELDSKFKNLAQSYKVSGLSTFEIKEASHRVLADQPEQFVQLTIQLIHGPQKLPNT